MSRSSQEIAITDLRTSPRGPAFRSAVQQKSKTSPSCLAQLIRHPRRRTEAQLVAEALSVLRTNQLTDAGFFTSWSGHPGVQSSTRGARRGPACLDMRQAERACAPSPTRRRLRCLEIQTSHGIAGRFRPAALPLAGVRKRYSPRTAEYHFRSGDLFRGSRGCLSVRCS